MYNIFYFCYTLVEIEEIRISAAQINHGSWGTMEKLGFERTDKKASTYLDENGDYLKCYTYGINILHIKVTEFIKTLNLN